MNSPLSTVPDCSLSVPGTLAQTVFPAPIGGGNSDSASLVTEPTKRGTLEEIPLLACPACKSTEDHEQDARGVWHCGRCRWLFAVTKDGRPVNVLEFRSRRTRR